MIKRIIADIVLFASIFILPWYWTAVIGVVFVIFFHNFWELVVVGFFIDSLYSIPTQHFFAQLGVFTLFSIILFLFSNIIRKKIRLS